MPAYAIEDFKQGLDLRKTYVTAPAGTLRTLRNCFISAGAEIEKRTAFIQWGTAPVLNPTPGGSMGLLSRNGEPFVINQRAIGLTPSSGSASNGVPGMLSMPFPSGVVITHCRQLAIVQQRFSMSFWPAMAGSITTMASSQSPIRWRRSAVRTMAARCMASMVSCCRFPRSTTPTKWTRQRAAHHQRGSGYIDLSSQDADSRQI